MPREKPGAPEIDRIRGEIFDRNHRLVFRRLCEHHGGRFVMLVLLTRTRVKRSGQSDCPRMEDTKRFSAA